ncbi:hypothetical protein OG909_01565 [Streptomyces sp. NBC_01754]|nr:hypothetical protein [Streptomyces sp. NBC_01754]WSC91089.1 hypothetical protein OG909_01565 [Streptomyces sp. NBC_01754]
MLTADTPAGAFRDRLGFHEITVPDPDRSRVRGRSTQGCGGGEVGRY